MKITKRQLRRIVRESLSQEVPELSGGRKSSFQAHRERTMAANRAMVDTAIKQIADKIIKNPGSATMLIDTFQPAVELRNYQETMEGGRRIDSFLDKIEDGLKAQGVDRIAAIKFADSFLNIQ